MHRIRDSYFFVTTTVLALVVRSLASMSQPVARFPDSAGYENLSLWGTVDRFWPVPLMYSLLQSDAARVVGHVVLGIAAWAWLASAVSRLSRWPKTSFVAIMLIGLSPQVIRYDMAMLSESFGITFVIAAIAATMHVISRRTRTTLIVWMGTIVISAMTRPTHLVILIVAVCVVGFSAIRTREKNAIIFALVLVASTLFGFVQLNGHSSTSLLNFYTVLAERVMPDDERYEWFVEQGMPDIEAARTAAGYEYDYQLPADVADIVSLPVGQQPPTLMRVGGVELAEWARDNGWRQYVTYVVTHPSDTATRLGNLFDDTISPQNSEFLPLENGPMIPWRIFQYWQVWTLTLGLGLIGHYFYSPTRHVGHVIMTMAAVGTVMYAGTLLTSGIEHPRHGVTVSVVLRVLAITAVATASFPQRATRPTT